MSKPLHEEHNSGRASQLVKGGSLAPASVFLSVRVMRRAAASTCSTRPATGCPTLNRARAAAVPTSVKCSCGTSALPEQEKTRLHFTTTRDVIY